MSMLSMDTLRDRVTKSTGEKPYGAKNGQRR